MIGLAAPAPLSAAQPVVAAVPAVAETTPVEHTGDAADDPAIWVHPSDPGLSLVVGTDKKGALEVYDLTGTRLQRFPTDHGNNVDIRGDVVVSTEPAAKLLHVYRVNPSTRQLSLVGTVSTTTKGRGICLYSAADGALYAFTASAGGVVLQYQLDVSASSVTAAQRRRFDVGTSTEGCAVDDDLARFYVSEENMGAVWRYDASPTGGTARVLVDSRAVSGRYSDDTEGIAIAGPLLMVSSQGDSWFEVYDRTSNGYLGRVSVTNGSAADGCSGTDGIEAYAGGLGSRFPDGLFVCQDYKNTAPGTAGRQDFKLVDFGGLQAAFG